MKKKEKEIIENIDEIEDNEHYMQQYAHCNGVGCSQKVRRRCWRYVLSGILPRIGEYRLSSLHVKEPGKDCLWRLDVMKVSDDVMRTMSQFMKETDIARQIVNHRIRKSEDAVKIMGAAMMDAALAQRIMEKFVKNKADAIATVKTSLKNGDKHHLVRDNEMVSTIGAMIEVFAIQDAEASKK